MRIAKHKAQSDDLKHQSQSADMRKHLHAPLPYGYFGNSLHFSQLSPNANITGSGLDQVIGLVHLHVAALKEDEFWCGLEWVNSRKDDQGKFLPPSNMYGPELTCVNMESTIAPIGTHVNEFRPLMSGLEYLKDQKPTCVISCGECRR